MIAELGKLLEGAGDIDPDNIDPSKIKSKLESKVALPEMSPEDQERVMDRVAKFLNPKTAGPIYMIPIRGKVFVGRLLTAQEMLEVERRIQLRPGVQPTTGQILTGWINELLGGSYGWVAEGSPAQQVIAAHLYDMTRWPKLNPVDWFETRDPYIREEEIEPLWVAFTKWKNEVTPTADEIRFYYSRMG